MKALTMKLVIVLLLQAPLFLNSTFAQTFVYYGDVGATELGNPEFITYANGLIYVADDSGDEIEIFNAIAPFNHVATVGSAEIGNPEYIEIDNGLMYVADDNDNEIEIYSATAPFNHIVTVGSTEISNPESVHIEGGVLYVTDDGADEVHLYQASAPFTFIATIDDTALDEPKDIIVNNNYIFVLDDGDDDIDIFNDTAPFAYVASIGSAQILGDSEQFILVGDAIYVTDEGANEDVEIFSTVSPFAHLGTIDGVGTIIECPEDLTSTGGGNILLVADDGSEEVHVFNANSPYEFLTSFGSGILNNPEGVIAPNGNVFVMDESDDVIHIFSNPFIPTMGQWFLLILGLLLASFALIRIRKPLKAQL